MNFSPNLLLEDYSNKSVGVFALFLIIAVSGFFIAGCSSLIKYFEGEDRKTMDDIGGPSYAWSNFFNNECGPLLEFIKKGDDRATLIYWCAAGKKLFQTARRLKVLNQVELWAARDLAMEQLYELSNSRCHASSIYLGMTNATIKFPCALIHMTVTYEITARHASGDTIRINLKPKKVLITYGDGVQEFKVDGGRLIPMGPFKPFVRPESQLILKSNPNNLRMKYADITAWNKNQQFQN